MNLRVCVGGAGFALVLTSIVGASVAKADDENQGLIVATEGGLVRGFVEGAQRSFNGIPFAAPPVGPRRWRPPEEPARWQGIRDARQFGARCLQIFTDANGQNPYDEGSEDCLNLNVHVPAATGDDQQQGLAVMVWFFPGGNQYGDNRADLSALAKRGVIVVEPNYRLGVFGWFAHPLIVAEHGGTSPNFGLEDQTAALRWVQRNIRAFGGDPDNVTIFGSSAGAIDTNALLADPEAEGLFHKAIISFGWPPGPRLQDEEYASADIALAVGCGPGVADVVGCLRALPFDPLNDALNQEAPRFGVGPNPVVDGMTMIEDPMFVLRARGTVPLLVGYNNNDQSAFLYNYNYGSDQPEYGSTQADLDNWLGDGEPPWLPWNQAWATASDQYYSLPGQTVPPPLAPPFPNVFAAISAAQTDWGQGMSARYRAQAAADHGGTVYGYVFTHGLENPADPNYVYNQVLGATHMMQEILYSGFKLWVDPYYQPTPAELLLADRMGDIWTNFAKRTDPNGPGIPHWPRYHSSSEQVMILDDDMRVVSHYRSAQDNLQEKFMNFAPWIPYYPFPANGPCTAQYYCQATQTAFVNQLGGLPPDPYAPQWTIFQYPPTQMMLDGVGTNPWDSP